VASLADTVQGWLPASEDLRHAPSPHFDARPANIEINCLVIHNISLPQGVYGGPQIEDLFCGRLDCSQHPSFADLAGLRVSSHFLIRRDGKAIQFVSTHDRAWHAGVSSFQGRTSCNDFSIGIELEGTDHEAFAPIQLKALVELLQKIKPQHPQLKWVVGHSDIAPGRKTDPGPFFNWQGFLHAARRCGLAIQNPFLPHMVGK
jgi:N-acetyl-anhydromuramoyl-L-alanine amidase